MFNDQKRRSGLLLQHQDGRRGIAYHNDQIEQFSKQSKYIIRFFIDNDFTKGLDEQKRAVKSDKLKQIGLID